jgi:reactive intermediate/imine deaminase
VAGLPPGSPPGHDHAKGSTMSKDPITSKHAPAAIGPYSHGVRAGRTVYLSGQIGLDPATGNLVEGVEAQAHQVFRNLRAVAQAAGGELADLARLTLMLVDLGDFAKVNEIMATYIKPPYPARATFAVAALPRGARIEIDGILVLPGGGAAPSASGARDALDEDEGA